MANDEFLLLPIKARALRKRLPYHAAILGRGQTPMFGSKIELLPAA